MARQLTISHRSTARSAELEQELELASQMLRAAEAQLAEEQAAVNRFRMHCRLKIGGWVDHVLELRSEAQALITQLELQQQAHELGIAFDENDILGDNEPLYDEQFMVENDAVILPTDVPNDKAAEKRLYRELAKKFHPDRADGSAERAYATMIMASINAAYQKRDIDTLRDLAGEPDPQMVMGLSRGKTAKERRLNKQLIGCQRRLRKVQRQYEAMKQENTARLWRKAIRLEAEGLNWWDEVREELTVEADRLHGVIEALNAVMQKSSGGSSYQRR